MISGTLLVRGGKDVADPAAPMLCTDVPLSFWGGVDPKTGVVIDATHPLFGQCIDECILCIPSGRGSCTASQVLLELILQKKAPRALVLRDVDGLVCVGALVAQEVFHEQVPDILCLGTESFNSLLQQNPEYGQVQENGNLVFGTTRELKGANNTQEESSSPTIAASDMPMTEEEHRMLESVSNAAERMALLVMIRFAKLESPNPEYLDIAKAHIDGCTYIGPGGLDFVKKLVDASGRVRVPTTLNSVSADRRRWKELGVPPDYARPSIELGDAYLDLGCEHSFTCAPYLLPDPPQFGQDIIWGESNAVVYSNSVLGARTEKYADYLDICCAIVGKVPAAGVHLDKNRQPQIILDASTMLNELWAHHVTTQGSDFDESKTIGSSGSLDLELIFPTLGHLCGTLSDGKVPLLLGFHEAGWSSLITADHLKSFCAAFGTTGTSPLVHIAGVTPEARDKTAMQNFIQNCDGPIRNIALTELQGTFQELNSAGSSNSEQVKVDLIALGNPHLSLTECETLSQQAEQIIDNKHPEVRMMACIGRPIYKQAEALGYISKLEDFGVEFVNDTCWCMMLDPPVIPSSSDAVILTNSGKYAHYGPGLTKRRFVLGSTVDCLNAAINGKFSPSGARAIFPSWSGVGSAEASQRRTYAASRWDIPLGPEKSRLSIFQRRNLRNAIIFVCSRALHTVR